MTYKLDAGQQWLRDETTNELVGIKDSVDGEERLIPFISANSITGGVELSTGGRSERTGFKAALLGDSFMARCTNTVLYRELDWGWWTWMNNTLNRPFTLIYNGGVSGQKTDEILLRVQNVIDQKPDWCFVDGGINDISNSVAVADIVTNLKSIFTALMNSGIRVVYLATAPNAQAAGNSTKVNQLNQAIRDWCIISDGVIFADCYAATVNPTDTSGGFASGMSDDALHYSAKGARAAGVAVANAISKFVPSNINLVASAQNSYSIDATAKQILTNPLLSGSSGTVSGTGASGTIATGWNGGTDTGTVTSVFTHGQARTDGIGVDQQIVISAAASGAIVNMRQTGLVSRVAIGDTVYMSGSLTISGMTDVARIYPTIEATIDSVSVIAHCFDPSSSTYDQGNLTINFQTQDLTLTGTAITALSAFIRIRFGTSGSGAATIKVGRLGLFKR
jgi:lysophospholipase L1-like esterase